MLAILEHFCALNTHTLTNGNIVPGVFTRHIVMLRFVHVEAKGRNGKGTALVFIVLLLCYPVGWMALLTRGRTVTARKLSVSHNLCNPRHLETNSEGLRFQNALC